MNSEDLYRELHNYFPKNLDLMRHLHINACWEYQIMEDSTNNDNIKLKYYLAKKSEESLEMTKEKPDLKPDLILYFTEKAILNFIQDNPSSDEYFARYHKIMDNPQPGIEVDNQVNKPRLILWKIGYKKWQKDFNF